MSIPTSAASVATRAAYRQFSNTARRQTHFSGGLTSNAYRAASKEADRQAAKGAFDFVKGFIRLCGGLIREGHKRNGKSELEAAAFATRETTKSTFRAKKAIEKVSGIHID